MEDMQWELLTEVQGRLEADLIQSLLAASEIESELFQEAVGHHIYPVTVDGLGRVQIFVPAEKVEQAKRLIEGLQPPAGQG